VKGGAVWRAEKEQGKPLSLRDPVPGPGFAQAARPAGPGDRGMTMIDLLRIPAGPDSPVTASRVERRSLPGASGWTGRASAGLFRVELAYPPASLYLPLLPAAGERVNERAMLLTAALGPDSPPAPARGEALLVGRLGPDGRDTSCPPDLTGLAGPAVPVRVEIIKISLELPGLPAGGAVWAPISREHPDWWAGLRDAARLRAIHRRPVRVVPAAEAAYRLPVRIRRAAARGAGWDVLSYHPDGCPPPDPADPDGGRHLTGVCPACALRWASDHDLGHPYRHEPAPPAAPRPPGRGQSS